ncbi:uncharacterized protein LAESUDRAFT_661270 [Laetiporus sulphureus 93-53]|uniref:Uncharacterized protein n=1 Tax=Laetiporus sulphureus 93-53 TaxID=1314785 RepID=A0A165CEI5_9APHY|nr:uncharacterized protein LAESUDRAFT_661270 [Laetiporus sulphureus 93-53]KZT02670.1 hypothetical protein LAESUDRAFT_661270 [Laetiporus sulphureus 93-53]
MTGNNALRDATRTLLGTRGRPSSRYLDEPVAGPQTTRWNGFDPYAALGTVHPPLPATLGFQRKDGYAPARMNSPPPDTFVGRPVYGYGYSTDGTSSAGLGHIAGTSASSHDLLLGYRRYEGETSTATNVSNTDVLSPPPRNPKRLEKSGGVGTKVEEDVPARDSAASSIYSVASEDPFDDPTTSRLVIRNLPDSSSAGGDAFREPSRQD